MILDAGIISLVFNFLLSVIKPPPRPDERLEVIGNGHFGYIEFAQMNSELYGRARDYVVHARETFADR